MPSLFCPAAEAHGIFSRSTDADFREFVNTIYYPNATTAEIDLVMKLYPSDPAAGSPFGTGDSNVLYPQYKRLAAFQGDDVSFLL